MLEANTQLTRLLSEQAVDGAGAGFSVPRGTQHRLYCAQIVGDGAVSATVTFEGSCDGEAWLPMAAGLSLSGTDSDIDGLAHDTPWPMVRAVVASLTGTDATVTAYLAI